MIKQCKDDQEFLNICDKLKEVNNPKLTEKVLYHYMVSGLYSKQAFIYVSYDKDIMNGCLVLLHANNIFQEPILSLLFIWIDAHYPKLLQEFIEITEDKARELNINKIAFITNRDEKVINRKMGKYGFKKVCSTFQKELI